MSRAAPAAETEGIDPDAIVSRIAAEGYAIVEAIYSEAECDAFVDALEIQLQARIAAGSYCGNENNQVLDNYFQGYPELLPLIHQEVTDSVMRRLIDDDYVLISPSARNRRLMSGPGFGSKTSGVGWHTDTRFIRGKGVQPSLSYIAILCLDAFGPDNGATHAIPGSHLRYQRPPDRDADLAHIDLIVPKGGMAVIDTALWHRVGPPSPQSRWGIFNTYGPWFLKPYHRFNEMFSADEMAALAPIMQQLLHNDSIPPKDHDESMITLRRVRLAVEGK